MSTFVFFDSRVADIERLIAELAPDAQIVILDPAEDGVAQIAETLAGVTDLNSIHIISHGSSGTLYLGSTVLTEDDLAEHEEELAQIGAALSEDGDLLLYGCNVGAGAIGESFIASLASYTGADVAASDDATGSEALGGDWELEASTGAVEAQTFAPLDFAGVLAPAIDLTDIAAGTGGFVIYGEDGGDWSGFSVAAAGDVNGDGFDDLIIGAVYAAAAGNGEPVAGSSYVVFGAASSFGASVDLGTIAAGTGGFVIHGQDTGDFSGISVASAGDVNGDGFDDLIIGAFRGAGAGNAEIVAGESYVVFGKASGFGASVDLTDVAAGTGGFVIYGESVGDYSARSVASAGDINGDGFDDVIIGAYSADAAGNAKPYAGGSYVVFGKEGGFGASIDLAVVAAGTGGFVIHGQDAYDQSGRSVASAGDINGDGFDDLIIGAPSAAAAGNAKSAAGDSYVVFGKASGFGASVDLNTVAAGTGGFVIHGQDALDRSGRSVASAGDVNGDGYDDLIIGAPYGDASGNAKSDAGESYVVFGKASGFGASIDLTTVAAGTGGFVIYGEDAGDRSGFSVAAAGDVNGDGFDDLLIGAFRGAAAGNFKPYAGDSYVVFGKSGGFGASIDLTAVAAGTGGFVIYGEDADDNSGISVASAGDLDGDGFDDLIIGAFRGDGAGNATTDAGDSYVILGTDFSGVVTHPGSDGADSLTGSAGADIMIGGQGADTLAGAGGADVMRGGAGDDVLTVADFTFQDIDGGGGTDTFALSGGGMALDLRSVGNSKLSGIEAIDLSGSGNNFLTLTARELLNLSDSSNTLRVEGDAGDLLMLPAYDGAWLKGDTIGGYTTYTQGQSTLQVASAVTVEVAINATDVAAGIGGFVIFGQDAADHSGGSVASVGDLNGDGFDDLVIGAALADAASNGTPGAGDSYVVFGKASGFGASVDLTDVAAGTGGFVIYGRDASDRSGRSVASAGDINGDGYDDLIIGAYGGDGADNEELFAGDSYVIFGKASGFGASIDLATVAAGTGGFVIYGQDAGDNSGGSVASAGDVNGDGFDDLIIGAPFGDAAGNAKDQAGDSYVVFGKASGFGASIDLTAVAAGTGGFVIHGQDAYDRSGFSVASAGDVNGDGFDDLIIGARYADAAGNAKYQAGDSYVVFGKASGFGTSIDLTDIAAGTGGFVIHGQDAYDISGIAVASAGDINGDGFDDLIIGASGGDAAGNTRNNAGDSYVVFGRAGSFGASIDLAVVAGGVGGFVIYGQDTYDGCGTSVASAGDLNGDGFDDLIVGAPSAGAAGNAKNSAGESYVIFGTDFSSIVTHLGEDGADSLTGSAGADIMIGGLGADLLDGLGGADVMRGGAGEDTFVSGAGADRMDGGTGRDTADYTASGAAVTVNLATNVNSGGRAAGDRLADIENVTGSASGDALTGDTQANVLTGLGGNDTLTGGSGNDTLAGGSGSDTFVFAAGGGTDRITDFGDGDAIRVTSAAFTSLLTVGDGSTVGLNQVQLSASSGVTTLYFGLDGTAGADLSVQLTGTFSAAGLRGEGNEILFNHAPTLANVLPDKTAQVNTLFSFTVPGNTFADIDVGDGFTFSATKANGSALPSWLSIDPDSGELSGTPPNGEFLKNYSIKVIATDEGGVAVFDVFDLSIPTGGPGDDSLTGTAGADTIIANGGADTLNGVGDADSLDGGSGNDTLNGGGGTDTLNGGTGVDSLVGGTENDTYIVDNSSDLLVETNQQDIDQVQASVTYTLPANVEVLELTGSSAINGTGNNLSNQITGNSAANRLDGGLFDDILSGGAGNDTYVVDNANDQVSEGSNGGNDLVRSSVTDTLAANVERLTLTGSAVIDGTGNSLNNTLTGNTAANTLNGLGGNDAMSGGAGNDTYVVNSTLDTVTEALSKGTDLVQSSVTWSLGANVEKLTLTGIANRNGTGNELANTLTGNAGANTLVGDLGNDTQTGGAGADSLNGGDGADSLDGGAGDDTLVGGVGNDTLDGGSGTDSMEGGGGNDVYFVDTNTDIVVETENGGTRDQVVIQIDVTAEPQAFELYGNVEYVSVADVNGGGVNIIGNVYDNLLTGTNDGDALDGAAGNDTLEGLAGADTLDGGTGVDSLEGGAGDDLYIVDDALDVVLEESNGPGGLVGGPAAAGDGFTDTVNALVSYSLANAQYVENLTLSSTATEGTGNSLGNVITGNALANKLSGLGGADTLVGGAGKDTLTGGAGADGFVFASTLNANTNVDRIADFGVVNDTIFLDNDIFTVLGKANETLGQAAFNKGAGMTTAQDASDRIIYNTTNGNVYYDADGEGGVGAKLFAELAGSPNTVTYADFFIVG